MVKIPVIMSVPTAGGEAPDRRKRVRATDTSEDPGESEQPQKRGAFESAGELHAFERCDSNSSNFRHVPEAQTSDVIAGFLQAGSSDFLRSGLINTLSLKISKLQRDVTKLELALADKDAELLDKDKRIVDLQQELCGLQEDRSQLRTHLQTCQSLAARLRQALISTLRVLEDRKRKDLKAKLSRDGFRLGRASLSVLQDQCEEGNEVLDVKTQLIQITRDREALEKHKKQTKPKDEDLSVLQLKIALLQKEEAELRAKLEKMEVEKAIYLEESRRMSEEDAAAYGRSSREAWPVLHSRYLLLSLLGKGGYSEVYRGYDLEECREIAVKFHRLNPSWPEDLKQSYIKHALRENAIHRTLDHPRIVKHFDTLELEGCFCTVLELCQGEDLHKLLQRHKTLPEKEAKLVAFQIFQGLKYLGEQQVIHYDLKPHNILLHKGEVKITDFGLAKLMGPTQTAIELTSQGAGTFWYLPPECFTVAPTITSKVDVWSAGVVFFEMLFGQKPFGHNMTQEKVFREQVVLNAQQVNFPPRPAVSAECKEFLRKCLEPEQSQRWDVAEALQAPYLLSKLK